MFEGLLNYLGSALGGAGETASSAASGAASLAGSGGGGAGFLQNLGAAMGRSKSAGGGLAGFASALSPSFSQGFNGGTQAPPAAGGGQIAWPSQSPNSGGGLKF